MTVPMDSNDQTVFDDVDLYIASGKQYRIHGDFLVNGKASDLTCKQTAQVVNTTAASFSDIPGLAFPVYAGKRYIFKFYVTFQTAATTTGIGFNCSAPALTAGNWIGLITTGGSGTALLYEQTNTTLGTVLSPGVAVANTDYIAMLEGFFEPSADGVLQLRTRTEVEGSAITVQNTGAGYLIECG